MTVSTNRRFVTFEEHLSWVAASTPVNAQESPADRAKRIEKARKDFRYFTQVYFPHYATHGSADFHIKAANVIRKYPYGRFLLPWFRGSAKSVHANIFFPLWLKIQEPRQLNVMVLIGQSYDAASTLLGDLQAELEANQRYLGDYGPQVKLGSWEDGEFGTRDGCAFVALGRGQSPRGLRDRQHRPDYISIDDIDDDELVRNERRVDEIVDWLKKAVTLTMPMGRGRMVYSNNLIHERSVMSKMITLYSDTLRTLKQAGQDTESTRSIHYFIQPVNIRNAQGKVTWPSRYSDADVEEIERELGYAAAQTELYNNPIQVGRTFKHDWFQYKKLPKLTDYADLVAYYDGGFKNTGTSDSKSLVLSGLTGGEYHIVKAYCGKASRLEAVAWHYDLFDYLRAHGGSARWYMEEVFMLDLLYEDFKAEATRRGFPIPLLGDKRQKPDKDLRIQSLAGAWERGNAYLNAAEEANHHMRHLVEQFLAFEPGKKTLKDGPDAVEGGWHLLRERVFTSAPPTVGASRRSRNPYRF